MRNKLKILIMILSITICVICAEIAIIIVPPLHEPAKEILYKTGLNLVVRKVLHKSGLISQKEFIPILSPDRASSRRHLVSALYQAVTQCQFRQVAFVNSILAQEAFHRAYLALKAW